VSEDIVEPLTEVVMTTQLYVVEPEHAEIREPVDLDIYFDEPAAPEVHTDPLEQLFGAWMRLFTAPLAMFDRLTRVDELL
jgi:hypothetical protein